jgi:hypothetical protein
MTNPTLTRSPECALGYPEACTDPTCSDPFAPCDEPLATGSLLCAQGFCDECDDQACIHECHLPDRDEDAAWLWDDDRARRRADV